MSPRIIFLGENWYGSCARACCYALRRLGCDVQDIDVQTIFPRLRKLSSRLVLRLFRKRLIEEYNDLIIRAAVKFQPDILLAFKGTYVKADTLKQLRERNILLYNYYPDTSIYAHNSLIPQALPEYDCIFYTKKFFKNDVKSKISIKESVFVPHGYDPEIHFIPELDERDIEQFGHEVVVIATHTNYKEKVLDRLVSIMPNIDLHIYGNNWNENSRSLLLRKHIKGYALEGATYAKAINYCSINIAVMSGHVFGASQGDETTTRTFEIPACGGFMIHERTDEVLEFYEENKEIVCFGSLEELAEKIDYYLKHHDERNAIASAGYKRCVPAYSYDNRMAEIIKWHEKSSKA